MEFSDILLVNGAIVILAPLFVWAHLQSEKTRRDRWALASQKQGFTFSPDDGPLSDDGPFVDRFRDLLTFYGSRHPKTFNIVETEREGMRILLFDYRLSSGRGNRGETSTRTMVVIESPVPCYPNLLLYPRRICRAEHARELGLSKVDLGTDHQFASTFDLFGDEPERATTWLTPAVRSELLDSPLWMESHGRFMVWHDFKRIDAEEISERLTRGLHLSRAIRREETHELSTPKKGTPDHVQVFPPLPSGSSSSTNTPTASR